ncbi:MAG: Gfo/Idh/MocA family protein, partial [Alphaproteobacteria bacterium]
MGEVRWGVIGNAKIGRDRLQPAIEASDNGRLVAVASRSGPVTYDALLERDDIDAVYIPLPNHLHVEWSRRALEAGKHVLCEKSITLSPAELEPLMDLRPDLILSEAFMVRFNPQWVKARELVQTGAIGEVRAVNGQFSFYNVDPGNVRNQPNMGGGAILDIGCYPIFTTRFVLDAEPTKAASLIVEQPDFGTDILCSAIMDFPGNRHLNFTCSTQAQLHQRMVFQGTEGRLELKVPFNPYPG